jgi:hypothetical protein
MVSSESCRDRLQDQHCGSYVQSVERACVVRRKASVGWGMGRGEMVMLR